MIIHGELDYVAYDSGDDLIILAGDDSVEMNQFKVDEESIDAIRETLDALEKSL